MRNFVFVFLLFLTACSADEELSHCDRANGRVVYNSKNHCLVVGASAIINVNRPGHQALLSFTVFESVPRAGDWTLRIKVDLPETGLVINTAYNITSATVSGLNTGDVGVVESGTITFTSVAAGKWTGTFSCTVKDGTITHQFINGNFTSNYTA